MEFKINEIPSVCLNMIVKDESHIIEKTLEMLCNKINFSYQLSLAQKNSLSGVFYYQAK